MSVQSFGANILDARVKSLDAQNNLTLSTVTDDTNSYGRSYTHKINGPNVANPNDYVFNLFEKATAGQASRDLITVTTTNTGAPPFNNSFLTLKSNVITLDGDLFFKNSPSFGQAQIDISGTQVIVPKPNVRAATSVILVTPTRNIDIIWVEAGVNGSTPANDFFTIKVGSAVTANTLINYAIVVY
jgi:hypothetical protein